MRLAPLVALLLAAPALHAQPCTPDPVPASDYYPLNVGDEWVYHAPAFASSPEAYVQRRVLRADAATGQEIEQTCTVSIPDGVRTCAPERPVVFPDGLGAPLGSSPFGTCASDLGTSVTIGGTAYSVARVKGLPGYIDFPPPPFAAGIGPVGIQVGNLAERTDRFEYARIGGTEYGVRPRIAGPDPTPAAAYAPLAVGTVREYRIRTQGGPTTGYRRETVVRDTLIGGETWHVRRDQTFAADLTRTSDAERLARFDAASATVLERSLASGPASPRYPCRLDLDITSGGFPECRIGVTYGKGPSTVLGVPTTTQTFGYDFGSIGVAAGFGLVSTVDEGGFTDLVYARISRQTFGTRVEGLPFRPDLTPAADYYPLEVGNEWIYHYTENSVYGVSDTYERRRVLREETVDGLVYAVDQTCTNNQRDAAPAWACGTERRLRLDPATGNVVQSIAPGVTRILFCRLEADFGAPLPDGCDGVTYVEAPTSVQIGSATYVVPSSKRLSTLANVAPAAFLAGIGPTERPVGAFQTSSFAFARVRGVEYGQRPVAGESDAAPAAALALTAAPNPTAGALRLALALPAAQTVRLEAFDALGRRVWQTTAALGAGAQSVSVDASAWAPGVYVVRAAAGGASATARVVRR